MPRFSILASFYAQREDAITWQIAKYIDKSDELLPLNRYNNGYLNGLKYAHSLLGTLLAAPWSPRMLSDACFFARNNPAVGLELHRRQNMRVMEEVQ